LWYVDNEASNYMCGGKGKFIELDEKIKGNVSFRYLSKLQIQKKCIILIFLKDDSCRLITYVYFVHKLKSNILNLGQTP
jgi:hypothetical protein